ncbi:MAG: RNA polymerase sigma factor, partial [Verrucomicrobiales bacterium]
VSHPTVGGWLMKATAFESMRASEKENTRKRNMTRFQDDLRIATEDGPESNTFMQDGKAVLDDALSCLSATDRDVILMRFYEGKSFKAIAQVVGKSDDACQKRVTRALDRLGKLMRGRGVAIPVAALGAGLSAELGRATGSPGLARSISDSAIGSAVSGGAATSPVWTQLVTSFNSKLGVAVSAVLLLAVVATCGFIAGSAAGGSLGHGADEESAARQVAPGSGARGWARDARAGEEDMGQMLWEIVRRARLDLQRADWDPAMEARAAWRISKIRPRHVRQAIGLAELPGKRMIDIDLLELLIGHWTKADGAAAFEFLAEEDDRRLRSQVAVWAMDEPGAAIDRIVRWGVESETSNRAETQRLQRTVLDLIEVALKSWSIHDLPGAVAAFLELDGQNQASYQGEISRGEGLLHSMELIGGIRVEDPGDLGAGGYFGSRWARQDPQGLADWLDQHAVTHYTDTSRLHPRLLQVWLRSDPAAACEWWVGREMKAGRQLQIGQLIDSWVEFDLPGAATWLSEQSGGVELDRGVAKVAAQLAPDEPGVALAWATRIEDAAVRRIALEEVVDLSGLGNAVLDQVELHPSDREWLLAELEREKDGDE